MGKQGPLVSNAGIAHRQDKIMHLHSLPVHCCPKEHPHGYIPGYLYLPPNFFWHGPLGTQKWVPSRTRKGSSEDWNNGAISAKKKSLLHCKCETVIILVFSCESVPAVL